LIRKRPRSRSPDWFSTDKLISKILSDTDFYLAGGTALALQEGHRISIDLDFMSATFSNLESLIQTLRNSDLDFEVTMTSSRTVSITTGGVQVSFFGYDYPQLEEVLQS
jgi:hypothetical protein